jgi:hypothetical protein
MRSREVVGIEERVFCCFGDGTLAGAIGEGELYTDSSRAPRYP